MKSFPTEYDEQTLDSMYQKIGLSAPDLDLVSRYFDAFASFYEILSLKDAFMIFKRQNGDIVSEKQFIQFASAARHDESKCYFILAPDELYEEEICRSEMDWEVVADFLFMDEEDEMYYDISEIQKELPLYIPVKEKLLQNNRLGKVVEKTKQTLELQKFFQKTFHIAPEDAWDEVCDCDIVMILDVTEDIDAIIDEILDNFKIRNKHLKQRQIQELIPLLDDVYENTRLPIYRGFTPKEIEERTLND